MKTVGVRASILLALLGLGLAAGARAREGPVKIGALTASWGPTPQIVGLRDGLRELGYREPEDFVLGVRFTGGDVAALAPAARDLIDGGADLLFASGAHAVEAARAVTTRVPIVFAGGDDPVARGLAQTIARPGGNVTGVVDLTNELAGKRLELFAELVPGLRRVLVTYPAGSPWGRAEVEAYRAAAARLGVTLVERPLGSQAEARAVFAAPGAPGVQGILVSLSVAWNIPGFALEGAHGLPVMFATAFYVERGGLASYGPDYHATGRQAARLVDKIVRGAQPGEIPVESNPLIELALNVVTARRLGLEIPRALRLRATRLVE